jgi:hypothetical protein
MLSHSACSLEAAPQMAAPKRGMQDKGLRRTAFFVTWSLLATVVARKAGGH